MNERIVTYDLIPKFSSTSRTIVLGALACIGAASMMGRASAQTLLYSGAPAFQGQISQNVYSWTIPSTNIGPNDLVIVAMTGSGYGTASDSAGDQYYAPTVESNMAYGDIAYGVTKAGFSGNLTITTSQPLIGVRAYAGYSASNPPAVQPGAVNIFGYGYPYLSGTGTIQSSFAYPPYHQLPPAGDLIVAFGTILSGEGLGPDGPGGDGQETNPPVGNQWLEETGPGYNWCIEKSWPSPAAPTPASWYNFSEDNLQAANQPATLPTGDSLYAEYLGTCPNGNPGMQSGHAIMETIAFQP